MKPRASFANLPVGPLPRVAGVVSSRELLEQLARNSADVPCDLLEIRLDQFNDLEGAFDFFPRIENNGLPSFVTLRLSSEGGKWTGPDRSRLPIFDRALSLVSGVDVELQSEIAREVSASAKSAGKACIVSFHDFAKTPPANLLEKVIEQAQEIGSISKVVTTINSLEDVAILRSLLRKDWKVPLCVIGMGPLGVDTRLDFPVEGSCLTYGYLDRPSAPGQFSAAKLVEHLKRSISGYETDFQNRRRPAGSS